MGKQEAAAVRAAPRAVPAFETRVWRGKVRDYCVVIPVINEGPRITALLARMRTLGVDGHADILVVDGGSTDGSIDAARIEEEDVRAILVKTGPGRLSAQLRCAYAFACDQGYRGVITIDGNNKDDPAAIPSFIDALSSGVDMVQGSRFIPGGVAENTPWLRLLAIRCLHAPLLSLASGFRWTDTTQGFRAYATRVLQSPNVAPFRDVFQDYELLAYLSCRVPRLGFRCRELPTRRVYPRDGKIPTKIGTRGYLPLLLTLLRACAGRFDPKDTA